MRKKFIYVHCCGILNVYIRLLETQRNFKLPSHVSSEYNYIISRDNDCIFLQYANRKLLIKEVHCYA